MKEIYDYIKNNCKALYKAGSNAVPFLKNQRDVEYALFCDNDEDAYQCYKTLYPQAKQVEETIVKKSGKEEKIVKIIQPEPLINYPIRLIRQESPMCKIWAYIYHYSYIGEHYGEDIREYDYNILEHKREYIDELIAFYYENHAKNDKLWYHILIGLYILENNSYELTDSQKIEVQLAHDKQMTDIAYNYAKSAIKNYIDGYNLIDLTLNDLRIAELKSLLASTDYQAIKFAEGVLSAEEYADMKAQRQAWRDEINQLESEE